MLPEMLSSKLCSLNAKEDRLTFSVIFEITPEAEVVSSKFERAVIHNKHNFSYQEAYDILSSDSGGDDHGLRQNLVWANALAQKLRDQRMTDGAQVIRSADVKIQIDEDNQPKHITWYH